MVQNGDALRIPFRVVVKQVRASTRQNRTMGGDGVGVDTKDYVNKLVLLAQLVEGGHGGPRSRKVLIDEWKGWSDGEFSLVCKETKITTTKYIRL